MGRLCFCRCGPFGLREHVCACTFRATSGIAGKRTLSRKPSADPNEKFNRSVFDSNQNFNHYVLYPAAKSYNENVPEDVRDRVDAFTTNLSEPMVFANNILQLRLAGCR